MGGAQQQKKSLPMRRVAMATDVYSMSHSWPDQSDFVTGVLWYSGGATHFGPGILPALLESPMHTTVYTSYSLALLKLLYERNIYIRRLCDTEEKALEKIYFSQWQ